MQVADSSPPRQYADVPEDLRSRRRRLVQDDLARIAVRLFLERGYDAVSVEEIAAAAGMSERSFFRYFATKDEVLRRYRRTLRAALVQAFEQRPQSEPPVRALRGAYVETSHVPVANRPTIHALGRLLRTASNVWASELGESISEEAIVRELARRMGAGPDELRPAVIAAAVTAAAVTGWNRWVRSEGAQDPGEVVGAAIDALDLRD
jgi:AcrR family transcriptional regulator